MDSATKVGQSSKLKSPWKGPYVITAVKSAVLYKIMEKKNRESVIHHDRIKLCRDRQHPLWIRKLRNKIMNNNEIEPRYLPKDDSDVINISPLFDSESDMLIPNLASQSVVASEPLMQTNNNSQTDPVKTSEPQFGERPGRIRRRPQYLTDYTE